MVLILMYPLFFDTAGRVVCQAVSQRSILSVFYVVCNKNGLTLRVESFQTCFALP